MVRRGLAADGSRLVVGSGAIGIEFASAVRDLGVDVTVVEEGADPAGRGLGIAATARKAFERQARPTRATADGVATRSSSTAASCASCGSIA